jgi:hypothetical protein
MRTLVLAAAFVFSLSGTGMAAPLCAPDTFAGYISLGAAGCSIGPATVADFFLAPQDPLATGIAPTDIRVTPSASAGGVRLDFGVSVAAGAGEFFDSILGYSLSMPIVRGARLLMSGATATFDGVTTGVEDLCLGALAVDPSFCPGIAVPSMVVFTDGFGAGLQDQQSFSATSFIGVLTDIAVDGGVAGAASLGTISNVFTPSPVPEPATVLLVGAGLIAIARRSFTTRRAA